MGKYCRCGTLLVKGRPLCTNCLRSDIRRLGAAGVCCVLCDRVGHSARYCPQTIVGRNRTGRRDVKAEVAR
jgi:ribosomal protein L37AE/L43A